MSTFRHIGTLILGAFAGLALIVAGCDTVETDDDAASLRVLLTDAPGDFEHAVVTIESVYLQAGEDDEEGERVVLRDEPVTVDLLTLQNEVLDLVADVAVPSGTYEQLRLVISGGYVAVEQADSPPAVYASSADYAAAQGVTAMGTLQMPSFEHSGLKITLPAEAAEVEGSQNVVLLDFDVSQSFGHQAGQSGKWVMTPVIHATDLALTGTAEVALTLGEDVTLPSDTLSLADFAATLDKGGDVLRVPFEDADGDGTYTVAFQYLTPGAYPVSLVAPENLTVNTDVALPLDVTVASGEQVDAAVVITEATAAPSE